jgi:hypothetical protein
MECKSSNFFLTSQILGEILFKLSQKVSVMIVGRYISLLTDA